MPYFLFLTTLLTSLWLQSAQADVRFITDTENTAGYNASKSNSPTAPLENYTLDNQTRCGAEGYTHTKCDKGFFNADPCPYDYSFFANCCPEDYRFTATECQSQGKNLGPYSCGGFYKCQ